VKILSVVNFYCGRVNSQGGSKISMLNIIYLLCNGDKKLRVFVSEKGWFTEQLENNNIDYIIISEPRLIQKVKRQTNIILTIFYLLLSMPKLVINWLIVSKYIGVGEKVILNEPRDMILFLPMLFRKKVKSIGWVRTENINYLSKFVLSKMDEIIAVSEIVRKNVHAEIKKPVTRIYNFMYEKPLNINRKCLNGTINLAVVGSIQKIKGQLDAIKVLNKLQNTKFKLYIVGREFDQVYTEKVKKYVKKKCLSNSVFFLGHIDNIPNFLNEKIHITLIPSQTESFCRVAMESVSVGVPVVAYSVGGLKEVIINNETGFLVNKDSINDIYTAIKYLSEHKEVYQTMRNKALKDWGDRFYSESIKKQLYQVLN